MAAKDPDDDSPDDSPTDAVEVRDGAFSTVTLLDDMHDAESLVTVALSESFQRWQRDLMDSLFFTGGVASSARIASTQAETIEQRAARLDREAADRRRRELETLEEQLRETVKPYLLTARHATAWNDVVGNEAARRALIDAIETPIRHAELFRAYGKKAAKGVLLWGPPGNGKTMLAKAAAAAIARLRQSQAAEAPFLLINGPSIQSMWAGETERRIRAIFAYARVRSALDGQPLVIFVDEADSILPPRGGAYRYEEGNVATFLAEMDGLENSGAFVILATNRPHHIDAALLRDGRCDRKIKVERPDLAAATEILARCLVGVPLGAGLELTALAAIGAGELFARERIVAGVRDHDGEQHFLRMADIVSGAMMTGLAERAKENAFHRDIAAGGKPSGVTAADLVAAIDTIQEENTGVDQSYALHELAERVGARELMLEPLKRPALTAAEIRAARH